MTEEERQAKLAEIRASIKARSSTPSAELSEDPGAGEVFTGAVQNLPSSALQVIKDTAAPFMDPVGTAKNIGKLGAGAVEKLIPGEQGHEGVADAVGNYFADRYGSWDGFKRALRDDPAGVMADISVPLTGGGSLAARAPGVIGKVGRVARFAGGIEPVNAVVQTAKAAGKVIPHALGAHTGVGKTPLSVAYEAGKAGGRPAELIAEGMRGDGSAPAMLEVVDDARKGMGKAYAARSAQYTQDMSGIKGVNALPVSQGVFQSIGKAAGKALNMHRFEGVDFSPKTLPVRQEIYQTVVKWGNRDPQVFHTPEALDKMKREIGDIRDSHELGSPEFKAANDVYKAVDAEIDKAFPEYAAAMQNYAKNSKKLDNLSRTLSLGGKATDDTALRKLQSSMRHDVNTNFGGRMALIDELQQYSPGIKERLAGMSLNSFLPRGLSKHSAGGQLATAGALAMYNPLLAAPLGAGLLFSSPRLMGEAALASGKVAGAVGRRTPKVVKEFAPHMLRRPMLQTSRGLGMLSDEVEEDY
jgi:hypothetical protein